VKEWQSELWYVPEHQVIRFCVGAFPDALSLRQDNPGTAPRTRTHLASPLSCLAILTLLALAGIFITIHLPVRRLVISAPMTVRDCIGRCGGMLLFTCIFLPGALVVWRRPAHCHRAPWPNRLRHGIFLAVKVALVQPIMLCGFFVQVLIAPHGGHLVFYAAFILVLRWLISDQQQRCPVCLRLLSAPVRIGNASRTFLEWYGTESACSHGHGLLHVPENAFSYSRKPQWLGLDDSWSGLFAGGDEPHA